MVLINCKEQMTLRGDQIWTQGRKAWGPLLHLWSVSSPLLLLASLLFNGSLAEAGSSEGWGAAGERLSGAGRTEGGEEETEVSLGLWNSRVVWDLLSTALSPPGIRALVASLLDCFLWWLSSVSHLHPHCSGPQAATRAMLQGANLTLSFLCVPGPSALQDSLVYFSQQLWAPQS